MTTAMTMRNEKATVCHSAEVRFGHRLHAEMPVEEK